MQLRLRMATWLLAICTLVLGVLPRPARAAEDHTHRGSPDWNMDDPDRHWRLCEDCGEIIDIGPHDWGPATLEVSGSCTEDRVELQICRVCLRVQRTISPAPGHSWDSGTVIRDATCMEPGQKEYTCTVCGKSRQEELPLERHRPGGSWIDSASQHWQLCQVCGEKQNTEPHRWTPWVTNAGGKQSRHCTVCTRSEVQKVSAAVAPDLVAVTPEGQVLQKSFVRGGQGYAVWAGTGSLQLRSVTPGFSDVAPGAWYGDTVTFVYSHGLLQGVTRTRFDPDGTMTRAMLAAAIHRMEGAPACPGNYFSDVAPGSWYENAVNWAASQGILAGVGGGRFDPDAALTREQMVAILYRYAGYLGLDRTGRESLRRFADSGSLSAYAVVPTEWSVAAGLISGMGDGRIAPRATATRAEVATVLRTMAIRITEELGQALP